MCVYYRMFYFHLKYTKMRLPPRWRSVPQGILLHCFMPPSWIKKKDKSRRRIKKWKGRGRGMRESKWGNRLEWWNRVNAHVPKHHFTLLTTQKQINNNGPIHITVAIPLDPAISKCAYCLMVPAPVGVDLAQSSQSETPSTIYSNRNKQTPCSTAHSLSCYEETGDIVYWQVRIEANLKPQVWFLSKCIFILSMSLYSWKKEK